MLGRREEKGQSSTCNGASRLTPRTFVGLRPFMRRLNGKGKQKGERTDFDVLV